MPSIIPSYTRIPGFYRLFFTYLDPLICIWGASMDFFLPSLVLSSHIPSPPVPDQGHIMVLTQRGGGMLNFGIVSAVLLRYTDDVNVWAIVQAACLAVDLAYYWSVWRVLEAQGRLSPETWRAEDWGSIGITVVAGVVRAAFLMRVGFGRGGKGGKAQ
jgi:hypothetical protein